MAQREREKPVVMADVDGVLRDTKSSVPAVTREQIEKFHARGGIFGMITAAPFEHIPEIPAHILCAESGAVCRFPERDGLQIFEPGRLAIAELKQCLGIEVDNGLARLCGQPVIVEGPRKASLTLLSGKPPHYPDLSVPSLSEELMGELEKAIQEHELDLHVSCASDTTYAWVDIVSVTKARTMEVQVELLGKGIFFLGDGEHDFWAMKVPGVIPVGFSNSIPKIQELADKTGVLINLRGPDGGAAEFFRRLNEGEIPQHLFPS